MKSFWLKKAPSLWLLLLTITLACGLSSLLSATAYSSDSSDAPPDEPQQLASILPGPMPTTVIRVVDGDTVRASVQTWLGQVTTTLIRVRHIDTPELRGKCAREREQARAARALVASWIPKGSPISIQNIETDKYGGRVIADVILPNGQPLRDALIAAGLARPYEGKTRQPWCSPAEIEADQKAKAKP